MSALTVSSLYALMGLLKVVERADLLASCIRGCPFGLASRTRGIAICEQFLDMTVNNRFGLQSQSDHSAALGGKARIT